MTGNQGDDDPTQSASSAKRGDGKTPSSQAGASRDAGALDGDGQIERLDDEYALMMRAFDQLFGKGITGDTDAEIDPALERDLQTVIASYLASPPARELLTSDDPEKRLEEAMETQIRPLFEAIFATAQTHAKGAAAAIREGRDPATRTTANTVLDLSSLLEEDDS